MRQIQSLKQAGAAWINTGMYGAKRSVDIVPQSREQQQRYYLGDGYRKRVRLVIIFIVRPSVLRPSIRRIATLSQCKTKLPAALKITRSLKYMVSKRLRIPMVSLHISDLMKTLPSSCCPVLLMSSRLVRLLTASLASHS